MVVVGIPDNDTLFLALYQHVPKHVISKSIDVRRVLVGCLETEYVCKIEKIEIVDIHTTFKERDSP